MQAEAIFENIDERIQQLIRGAQKSVFVAVTYFANKILFNELVFKAKNGCDVYLIISNEKIRPISSIEFEQLNTCKSKVYKIDSSDRELSHNNFCVIDYSVVITGSYNWTDNAENNLENIIIISNDTTLAEQLISEFNTIRGQYYSDNVNEDIVFPLNKIIKRLEILENYIFLEDIEELNGEISKLEQYAFNSELHEIIAEVRKEEFASAIYKIQYFISKNQQLTIWTDPEIAALKLEIRILENQLNGYANEKIELEKFLFEFQHRHTVELGEVILDILKMRKLKFKSDKTKYQEAENDERQYREQVHIEKEKEIFELTDVQKLELKKKFRKATVLCHPDKFANEPIEVQKQAEEIFKELNEANVNNDLQKVSEILANLEKGILSTSKGDKLSDKDKLLETVNRLRVKVKILENEIITIKQSETFKTIINIDDWGEYFKMTKELLQRELEELQLEIGT